MKRLIVSHLAIAAFAAGLVASWHRLSIYNATNHAGAVALVLVYGGFTVYIVISQVVNALHEARQAVLYPAKVQSIAQRFDLQDGC